MSFLRNNLTCASLTMEPHLAPSDFRAVRTATSGQFNCRQQADLIVVDHDDIDAFISKLNSSGGALLYSTYLSGNSGGGEPGSAGSGIAVDSSGNAYVIGDTGSTDFPTTAGAFQTTYGGGIVDAFVTKIFALTFAGHPGALNCHGQSASALSNQYGSLVTAARALGFPSVQALQNAIRAFCGG